MASTRSDTEPNSHSIKWHYQDTGVARAYDGDRFTAFPGRVLNRLERRVIEDAIRTLSTGRQKPLVLDAPCGTGRITEWLLGMGCEVIAADIAAPMIEVARARCARFGDRVRFVQADLESLTLPDRSVDVVTCVRLFHHLATEQRGRILKELGRVSRDAVIVNVALSSPYYRLRRRLKQALRQGISRCSSTWAEIDREAGDAGLSVASWRFVARYLSEDLFVLMKRMPDTESYEGPIADRR